MKRLQYTLYSLAIILTAPSVLFASTSGGSALSAQIDAISKIQAFNDLLSGPILLAIGTFFAIMAGFGIMKSKANNNRSWEWMGRIGIGMVIITAAAGIINTVFGGGTI